MAISFCVTSLYTTQQTTLLTITITTTITLKLEVVQPCHSRHQLKNYYCKFLPKTQSLDIVDETAIANIANNECVFEFESINEENASCAADENAASCALPKNSSIDNNNSAAAARPIFPNLSFSPYGSPRISRKPARESRRVSIDKNGSFLQLNQYKLLDQIGVGSYGLGELRSTIIMLCMNANLQSFQSNWRTTRRTRSTTP